MLLIRILMILTVACWAGPAQAQMYKWVDENGKVQTFNNENADFNNLPGSLKNEIENEDSIDRTNYSSGDNRDFNDGDRNSVRDFKLDGDYSEMYNSPNGNNPYQESTTLINNEASLFIRVVVSW